MNKKNNFKQCLSACLVGIPCRYNAKSKLNQNALHIYLNGNTLILCPEIIAGLPTPRSACEIVNGDGDDVLERKAKVLDAEGNNYTDYFIKGAYKALEIIKNNDIQKVYLKSGSPSCGVNNIFDGEFKGNKKKGDGVLTALLKRENINVIEIN